MRSKKVSFSSHLSPGVCTLSNYTELSESQRRENPAGKKIVSRCFDIYANIERRSR
jgi:hypothetical protein